MEAPYILFQAGKINFLVLMEYVDVIDRAGSVSGQNIPVYDFAGICGLKKNGGRSSYALLMHTDSCRFGIVSDKVVDVVNISDGDILSLEGPALWEKNNYLAGVVWTGNPEPPAMYYIDVPSLYERVSSSEPDYWF